MNLRGFGLNLFCDVHVNLELYSFLVINFDFFPSMSYILKLLIVLRKVVMFFKVDKQNSEY